MLSVVCLWKLLKASRFRATDVGSMPAFEALEGQAFRAAMDAGISIVVVRRLARCRSSGVTGPHIGPAIGWLASNEAGFTACSVRCSGLTFGDFFLRCSGLRPASALSD